jgi:hypothetical protein
MLRHTTLPAPEGLIIRWSSHGELFVEVQVAAGVFTEPVPDGLSIPFGTLQPGLYRIGMVVCVPVSGALPRYIGRLRLADDTLGSLFLGNQLPQMNPARLRRPGIVPDHQVTPDLVNDAMHFPVQSLDGPAAPHRALDLDHGGAVLDFYDSLGETQDNASRASSDMVAETLALLRSAPSPVMAPTSPPVLPPPKTETKRAKKTPATETKRGAAKKKKKGSVQRSRIQVSTIDRSLLQHRVSQLHSSVIASAGVCAIETLGSKAAKTEPSGSTTTCGGESRSIMRWMTAASPAAPPPCTVNTSM